MEYGVVLFPSWGRDSPIGDRVEADDHRDAALQFVKRLGYTQVNDWDGPMAHHRGENRELWFLDARGCPDQRDENDMVGVLAKL